jgi:hypothetical protein
MNRLGVQTRVVVDDASPTDGFSLIKRAGFDCADFSLNQYLKNSDLYRLRKNSFLTGP